MTVLIHQSSADRKLIAGASLKPCPFCANETLHVCATTGSLAICCDSRECRANVYFNQDTATSIRLWNERATEAES